MLDYCLYKTGEFLALALPWKLAYRLGAFLAHLQFLISKKDRQAVMNNLSVIMPDATRATIKKTTKEVFLNFGLYLVEFFRFSDIDKNYVESHFSIIGQEYLDDAMRAGKGAILLTAHIGNWELGGMALSLLGYPIIAIALEHKDSKVNDFFKKRRESKGMQVVSLGISIKQCYKGLKNNKLIAILGDRDFGNSGSLMDFLRRRKRIPRGPVVLAKRTGAPIIPIFVLRKDLDHFNVECFPPIVISDKVSEKEVMQNYLKIIEEQIYKYPSQWLMFREFWKE